MKILLVTLAWISASSLFGEKLINAETGSVIVEFLDGKIQFYDRFLETEMKESGIYIPRSKTSDFQDKEIVYLGDPMFEKAFIDVYYPFCIANSLYQWEH